MQTLSLSPRPPPCHTHPLRTPRWWKRATFCTGSLLIWPFQPPHSCFAFCRRSHWCCSRQRLKSLSETECLHSFNQRNTGRAAGWLAGWLAGGRRGRAGKRAPATSSVPRKKGLVSRSWRVSPGCDVSHFRTDGTMRRRHCRRHNRHLSSPPFLSCQMNACSLGYRTEEVIHQK